MLGLRTRQGILRSLLMEHLGAEAAVAKLKPLLGAGFLVEEGERVRVAPRGYFVLNGILNNLVG